MSRPGSWQAQDTAPSKLEWQRSGDTLVVTRRRSWCVRLEAVANLYRGIRLLLCVSSVDEALKADLEDDAVLVFDRLVDESIMSRLPALWLSRHPDGFAVLVSDYHDAMFERSAIACGYRGFFVLEDALRVDFINELLSLAPGDHAPPIQQPADTRAMDTDNQPVVLVTLRGHVLYANPAFFRRIGRLPGDSASLSLVSLVPELSARYLSRYRRGWQGLLELRRASGNTEVVRATMKDLDAEGEGLLAIRL